jgi:hypothetical protein
MLFLKMYKALFSLLWQETWQLPSSFGCIGQTMSDPLVASNGVNATPSLCATGVACRGADGDEQNLDIDLNVLRSNWL